MYWKASIDLSRPQVASMGHHDPLDGFITCLQLEATAARLRPPAPGPRLVEAAADFAELLDPTQLATGDPLGLGGLLIDAHRVGQLMQQGALASDEDLLEALVGDLPEPGQQEEPSVTQRADGSWLVDGMLPIDQLKDTIGLARLPDEDEASYQTVAGLVMDRLRRIPKAADWFEIDDHRFEVVDMDGRRIDKVMVSRKPAAREEGSEAAPAA